MSAADRYIGLDVHKYYLIAIGVDKDLNRVYGPRRVELSQLGPWIERTVTPRDAVVLEMTSNAWQIHDELAPHAKSVTVVHPPHVALIVRAQVMNDRIAALQLARLLAKGLLVGIWVPPEAIRDLRTLVAQRCKMTSLKTQAKCRLQATLHRHHILPNDAQPLYSKENLHWWASLAVTPLEQVRLESDLATLEFAERQISSLEAKMAEWAASEPNITRLMQLTGIGLVCSVTMLAAIGDIRRFPTPRQLVGYSGLGARVHDSGMTTRSGGVTKAGRRELRAVLVEAAQVAVIHDAHWKSELERLEVRLGRSKAIVAIARKLLVVAWHLLAEQAVLHGIDAERMARKFKEFAYSLDAAHRSAPAGVFIRERLDLLGIGGELDSYTQGKRRYRLPRTVITASAPSRAHKPHAKMQADGHIDQPLPEAAEVAERGLH